MAGDLSCLSEFFPIWERRETHSGQRRRPESDRRRNNGRDGRNGIHKRNQHCFRIKGTGSAVFKRKFPFTPTLCLAASEGAFPVQGALEKPVFRIWASAIFTERWRQSGEEGAARRPGQSHCAKTPRKNAEQVRQTLARQERTLSTFCFRFSDNTDSQKTSKKSKKNKKH